MRLTLRLLALCVLAATAPALAAETTSSAGAADQARIREIIVKALAGAGDADGQAHALARLAWPNGKRDEAVASRARRELVNAGNNAFMALRDSLNTVKTAYTEEVVATTLAAAQASRVDAAREYIASMIDALWVGSRAAKILAIHALAADRNAMAVAPMIDSAIEDPALTNEVVEALGKMRFQQARFYLDKMMMEGPAAVRPLAASALAQIGGAALAPLKTALKAPTRDARLLAARALLPAATEYELGAIYEYVETHGDDDPALTQALKASAVTIEKAIAARDARKAADSPKDF